MQFAPAHDELLRQSGQVLAATCQFLPQHLSHAIGRNDIANAHAQFFRGKWLSEIVLRSVQEQLHAQLVVRPGGQQNDGNTLQVGVRTHCPHQLVSTQFGHHDVAQDHVRPQCDRLLQAFAPVARVGQAVIPGKCLTDKPIHVRIVLHHQNQFASSGR